MVTNCDIHGNNANCNVNGSADNSKASVYLKSGLLVGSRIHDNRVATTAGSFARTGVRMDGGTMLNCLVYNNYSISLSAGVYHKGGTLAYCTFYGNELKNDSTGGSGIHQTGGTACNNIFYGNGPAGSTLGSAYVTGGTFVSNVNDVVLQNYPLNRAADPKFRDAENADFTILNRASSAYAAAAPLALTDKDFAGATRSATAPTIGAYEYDPLKETLGVDIRIETGVLKEGSSGTAEAIVSGAGDAPVEYEWYLDGQLVSTDAKPVFENLAAGYRHLQLVVRTQGQTLGAELEKAFDVKPVRVYVNTTGTAEYPYDTEEKGTTDLNAAFSALWRTADTENEIHLGAGKFTVAAEMKIETPIKVLGVGTNETMITGSALPTRIFSVGSAFAGIYDVCFSNMTSTADGGAVYLTAGEVRRCKFYSCKGSGQTGGKGVAANVAGGFLGDCSFEKCEPNSWFSGLGVLYATAGVVSNVTFSGCTPGNRPDSNNGRGTALYVKGGFVTDAKVLDCGDSSKAGVRAVVMVESGTLQNSLVCGNRAYGNDSAGVYQSGGTVRFCTIYGNVAAADTTGCSGLRQTGGTAQYNVISGNGPSTSSEGSCLVDGTATFNGNVIDKELSAYPANTAADPGFADAENRNFHPASGSSPLVDKVEPQEGDPVRDLDGILRDEPYDIGAYEYDKSKVEFSVGVSVPKNAWKVGDMITAEAVVEGAPSAEIAYLWKLDGETLPADTKQIELRNLACGTHSLYVQATADGRSVDNADRPGVLTVQPTEVFVSKTGSDEYPYDTEEKATPSVDLAWAAVWKGGDETGVVPVYAVFAEGSVKGRAGERATVECVLDESEEPVVAVPTRSIVQVGLQPTVFVKDDHDADRFLAVQVTPGLAGGGWTAVAGLPEEDAEVVVEGAYELKLALPSGAAKPAGHFHADGTFHEEHGARQGSD